jgi:hypothetical protein
LRRFLAVSGGFVDQISNYSFGTALTFLPHTLGSAQAVTGPLTSWSSIAIEGRRGRATARRQLRVFGRHIPSTRRDVRR